jgi:nitrous oxide reductase accessory protein NosL
MLRSRTIAAVLVALILVGTALAEELKVPAPGPKDTCPVCGMFVARYPEWIATVLYKDGHAHHFDGAKDLFTYLLDMPRWAPGHSAGDIATIAVTDYYALARIDARGAWYVVGSDTLGPMGHELIPLGTREDAEGFLTDHAGRRILRFEDVTQELIRDLNAGRF